MFVPPKGLSNYPSEAFSMKDTKAVVQTTPNPS